MPLPLRALIAVVLMAGFYILALGAVGALYWLAYYDFMKTGGQAGMAIFGLGIGTIILWSVLPRLKRFEAPGPELTRDAQPELFAVLEDVASATRQKMPANVYLFAEVNAGVRHRGRRRVMEIGLPLMQALTVTQFRAIVAHELGHYDGGDTKLGPLVYRTHDAIERTVDALLDDDSFIDKPFLWYGRFFLRVTHAVSRAQELAADRLAARVAGAGNAAAALLAIERAAAAFPEYWDSEVAPLLTHGFCPPIAAGFERFLAARPDIVATPRPAGPYDSHPPHDERIAALGGLVSNDDGPRAGSLLRDLPRLEAQLLDGETTPVSWEDAPARVHIPSWRGRAAENEQVLREVTPLALPAIATRLYDFSARLKLETEDGEQTNAAARIVAGALAVRLHDLGWMCEAEPGKPLAFTRDGRTIEPFNIMSRLRAGTLSQEVWEAECRAAGIDGATLSERPCATPG